MATQPVDLVGGDGDDLLHVAVDPPVDQREEIPLRRVEGVVEIKKDGVHAVPADHPGERMDEYVDPAVGDFPPQCIERGIVERLVLQFGADDHAGEAQLVDAAGQFGLHLGRIERRHVGEPDEAPRIILGCLFHLVVDEGAGGTVGIVVPVGAGQHGEIDPCLVHHGDVGVEVRQQRIEQIGGGAVGIQARPQRARLSLGLAQLPRRVVMLEIDDHRPCSLIDRSVCLTT